MVDRAAPTRFSRGQQIVRQGEASAVVAVISEGVVRLSKMLSDGRRQVVGFALAGDLIGAWLSEAVPYDADVLTPTVALMAPRADFIRRATAQVLLMRRLQVYTMKMLTFSQEHIAVLGRALAEEKLAWFLLRWRERWEERVGKSTDVPLPMTRQDIADYLGLTIETVSRAFTRLKDEGIIQPHRERIEILDPGRLRAMGMLVGEAPDEPPAGSPSAVRSDPFR